MCLDRRATQPPALLQQQHLRAAFRRRVGRADTGGTATRHQHVVILRESRANRETHDGQSLYHLIHFCSPFRQCYYSSEEGRRARLCSQRPLFPIYRIMIIVPPT